uniref:Uncharacterized protein n=1 Tax=Tanacetum cinerariifolium TaxID=118510 RepID=A0A6L2MD02_TANCI|nr:hypothetical protein [Tanacetum cinerariifolium]
MSVLLAKERILKLIQAWDEKQIKSWSLLELLLQLSNDSRTIDEMLKQCVRQREQVANLAVQKNQEEESIQFRLYLENSSKAIAPVLPTKEPEYSLSMGNEHLDTILETESNELIKSSVENLVLILCEYEVTFDNENELIKSSVENLVLILCEYEVTFDNEKIISTKIDLHLFKLAHINPIPPGIKEADFDLEEEIRLVENLSYDNSSPRPPGKLNAEIVDTIVESLFHSTIPVEMVTLIWRRSTYFLLRMT